MLRLLCSCLAVHGQLPDAFTFQRTVYTLPQRYKSSTTPSNLGGIGDSATTQSRRLRVKTVRWRPEETERLSHALQEGKTSQQCVPLFPDRTLTAIACKTRRMQLLEPTTNTPRRQYNTDSRKVVDLARMGLSADQIMTRIPHRSLRYIIRTARDHGLLSKKSSRSYRSRWTEGENETVLQALTQGVRTPKLPGRSRSAVEIRMAFLKTAGFRTHSSPRRPWSSDEEDRAVSLDSNGMLQVDIAETLQRSLKAVNARLILIRKGSNRTKINGSTSPKQ